MRDKVLTAEGGQDHNGAGAARIVTLAGYETCSPLVAGGEQELYMSLHQHSGCCWLKRAPKMACRACEVCRLGDE